MIPFTGKPIDRQLRSLSPHRYSNILFGEILTLRLNVVASEYNKIPNGLGELTFSDQADPTNPFNGQMVKDILMKADTMISCDRLRSTPATNADLMAVVNSINTAFSDSTLDTVSFVSKTVFGGKIKLIDVPYLHSTPGAVPVSLLSPDVPQQELPSTFMLYQNYPNPFNPATQIEFDLQNPSIVTLKIYNMLGQEVATLLDQQLMDEGLQEVEFTANNLASGVYFYRVTAEQIADEDDEIPANIFIGTKKMLLVK
jgi:hypothetical protein